MPLAELPAEIPHHIISYLDYSAFLKLTSLNKHFYKFRSPLNKRRILESNDCVNRKSTLKLQALPFAVQTKIYDLLDNTVFCMFASTCHWSHYYCKWYVHRGRNFNADINIMEGYMFQCNKIASICVWDEGFAYLNGCRFLKIRARDLPCFTCLRLRPRCEINFKEWQNFGQRQCRMQKPGATSLCLIGELYFSCTYREAKQTQREEKRVEKSRQEAISQLWWSKDEPWVEEV
jgi:hypothetical protein